MRDVMLDLETLGTKPGSVIRSIGAVFFDPLTGKLGPEFYANIDEASCLIAGLTMDVSTVKWWSEQKQEARSALETNPMLLNVVGGGFNFWWTQHGGENVWARGTHFDCVLWEEAMRKVDIRVPWRYNNVYDTRTVDTVRDALGGVAGLIEREGTFHNALDDCKHQVRCVAASLTAARESVSASIKPKRRSNAA